MRSRIRRYAVAIVCCLFCPLLSGGQGAVGATTASRENPTFSRLNTWSVASEYVPTTQHYFLGQVQVGTQMYLLDRFC